MSHSTRSVCIIESNNSSDEIAKLVVQQLSKEYKVQYMTYGFRSEFDGKPVVSRETGEIGHGSSMYWGGNGDHLITEYAVIENGTGNTIKLIDYRGSAGRPWSGNARTDLINSFRVLGNDVEQKEPSMWEMKNKFVETFKIPL